ncbi:MAG: tetratricopeptide repeat protein [Acidimicrobiia bacterium]|nr:tetratricopeptide repeat protein [Acidimicrobiia bacterium]
MPPTGSVPSVLGRASAALERGRGAEATQLLAPLLRSSSLTREDELTLRALLAEAWLLQDDLTQAANALGRTPDMLREPAGDAQLAAIWRLHGKINFAKGETSRAIALQTRALKHAELAHDSRGIGLAHFELALCYRQVGDLRIVRDHLTEAASALHAAGDRRHLALVHSLSGVLLAQTGRHDDATAALRQGERLAMAIPANDVLATIVHNQANVALLRHQHDQALALAERSVAIHEAHGSAHGLAVALATLGAIFVQVGELERAEQILDRMLKARTAVRFAEATGAVFDTLAQIHLMRGAYEKAADCLRQAGEAFGANTRTTRWYEWGPKVLSIKVAIRRGACEDALAMAEELIQTPGIPGAEATMAELGACEALVAAGRVTEAERRLAACEGRLEARVVPSNWGEFLRIRGAVHERAGRPLAAHHDYAQSATVFNLLGERHQEALSQVALARVAVKAGTPATGARYLDQAEAIFRSLGAERDLEDVAAVRARLETDAQAGAAASITDIDEAVVRRLVDAAVMPDLLARETSAAVHETTEADATVVFVAPPGGDPRVLSFAGCDEDVARALARAASQGSREYGDGLLLTEPLGRHHDGPRFCTVVAAGRMGGDALRRLRMFGAVARQGFELCGARERPPQTVEQGTERPIEPLLPGFICASTTMNRVVEQIQRLQGHDLTVLITGESGTGKDLVARAIHVGSPRRAAMFLPYNCTTTTRELADSQLFGHRRGSFTGAVTDQQGLIRSAIGGTLFLDEIGDLPLDIQPKLLRFLEQGEIMPVGETRPQAVDVRVLAATNADLEQRVAEGKFREDLYYRLSVIRIHVPPLRERREEIPHLSTFFLREASDRLGKPDVHLSSATLDLFANYWWPGNVRQLRNEIQRAVAMSAPGGAIAPEHLSADLSAPAPTGAGAATLGIGARGVTPRNLAAAIEQVERDMIKSTLDRTSGNISETARVLGLTRRGLYLKLRRLGLDGAMTDTQ